MKVGLYAKVRRTFGSLFRSLVVSLFPIELKFPPGAHNKQKREMNNDFNKSVGTNLLVTGASFA